MFHLVAEEFFVADVYESQAGVKSLSLGFVYIYDKSTGHARRNSSAICAASSLWAFLMMILLMAFTLAYLAKVGKICYICLVLY